MLTQESMQGEYADELAIIKNSLTETADILIYGYNFDKSKNCESAVETLAEITGAYVALAD